MGAILVMLIVLPALALLNGLVLATLWGWFLVPLGAPSIGIATAVGISIVVYMLVGSHEETTKGEKDWADFVGVFLRPLIALAYGWIVHLFI